MYDNQEPNVSMLITYSKTFIYKKYARFFTFTSNFVIIHWKRDHTVVNITTDV